MSLSSPIRKLAGRLSHGLSRFPALHGLLRRLFLKLPVGLRGPVIVHDSLARLAKSGRQVFFVQIGANDGDQNDPVRHFVERYHWRGILVEPVPEYFAALKENYGSKDGIHFENVAISDSDTGREFWYLENSQGLLPEWARGLGSFFKEEVTAAKVPGMDLRPHLRSIEVPCLSLGGLLDRHDNPGVDLLVIDAQGFDGKLIKQIDFSLMKPAVIVFEHNLLDPDEKKECRNRLESEGYRLTEDSWDIVAELRP